MTEREELLELLLDHPELVKMIVSALAQKESSEA